MAKKVVTESKTDRLRALRLADETARKSAGTWGEMTVGEIVHEPSRSVFVQVWKGPSRPDPFRQGGRQTGIAATEWMAITSWVKVRKVDDFSQSIIAWDITADEARRIAEERIAAHRRDGYTVVNPVAVAS